MVNASTAFEGSAYNLPAPSYIADLVEVGRGKPMGELLRRYWQPVATAEQATTTPRKVRILGEDLVLFRDGRGRPGLLHSRCCHRGTTLYYGRVSDEGIQCCYHGWVFDHEGRCLRQPCEPKGGINLDEARQPWYPVRERYGLIFAYMGPPDAMPVLPRFNFFEELNEGDALRCENDGYGAGGPVICPVNWLQFFENIMDPFHIPILHNGFGAIQHQAAMALLPKVTWEYLPAGMRATSERVLPNGRLYRRSTEAHVPNVYSVPSPFMDLDALAARGGVARGESVHWVIPVDDGHFTQFAVHREDAGTGRIWRRTRPDGEKAWEDMTEEEHQRHPYDYEAQIGQGQITWHSEEHLRTSDRGVSMLRRLLLQQVRKVEAGEDPLGLIREEAEAMVRLGSVNRVLDAEGATA